jgi:hypothetical protein
VALKERIGHVAATMFQIAFHQTRVLPLDSKETEAADSQAAGKEDFLSCLKNASDTIAQAVTKMLTDFAAFKGISGYDKAVDFAFDVTVEDVDQELAWIMAFKADIDQYPEWRKQTLKRVVDRMNIAGAEEIKAEIDETEIEPATMRPGDDILRGLIDETEEPQSAP